jgi:hypothetical protein
MKNLMNFNDWNTLNEAEGVSKAAFSALEKFFGENPDGSFEDAKKYVADQVEGWDLSQEDYDEAKNAVKD